MKRDKFYEVKARQGIYERRYAGVKYRAGTIFKTKGEARSWVLRARADGYPARLEKVSKGWVAFICLRKRG